MLAHGLATFPGQPHVPEVQTDFHVFRERLEIACQARTMPLGTLLWRIGLGGRRMVDFYTQGIKILDLYRVCQIADILDVSIDWLLGRSNVMSVVEMPDLPNQQQRKLPYTAAPKH